MREKLFEYVANQYGINFDELCQWIDVSYSATN